MSKVTLVLHAQSDGFKVLLRTIKFANVSISTDLFATLVMLQSIMMMSSDNNVAAFFFAFWVVLTFTLFKLPAFMSLARPQPSQSDGLLRWAWPKRKPVIYPLSLLIQLPVLTYAASTCVPGLASYLRHGGNGEHALSQLTAVVLLFMVGLVLVIGFVINHRALLLRDSLLERQERGDISLVTPAADAAEGESQSVSV